MIHAKTPIPRQRFQRLYSFGRTMDGWRIAPVQPIAIDEDNATKDAMVTDPWAAMALGKERPKPGHLRFGQSEQVAQRSGLLADRESRSQSMIHGS